MKKFLLKNYKPLLSAVILLCVLALPLVAGATIKTEIQGNLTNTNLNELGGGSQGLPHTIGLLITAALGLLGVVFVVLIILAGFKWMMTQGDATKVKAAKDMMIQAVIGLIIILVAYGITNFVITAVFNASGV